MATRTSRSLLLVLSSSLLSVAGATESTPDRYLVTADSRAANPAQRFEITFRPAGVTVVPEGQASWRWTIALASWGRAGALRTAEPPSLSTKGDRVDLARGGIHEWYVNSPAGLEQGFTIFDPPGTRGDTLMIDLTLSGDLRPRFAEDGRAIDFYDRGSLNVLHYASLSVVDARGTELAARFESRTGGARIVIDDAHAVYPVTIDPLTSTPAWTGAGQSEENSYYGRSVSTAGDVNGDGFSDVIVGADCYDATISGSEGRATVYLGSASGLATTASRTYTGDEAGAFMGHSVAAVDVNGDGYGDVIIGAYGHDAGGGRNANRGRAYVYLGGTKGLSTTPSWVVSGDQNGAEFGYVVASAGDVNGDGYGDVLVGAPYHDGGGGSGAQRGRVYLYLGSATGLSTTPAWTASGEETMAFFGSALGTAGDVNGDGYDDVVVGAWGMDAGGGANADRGKVYVYLGSATGLATTPVWTATGDQNGAYFGYSVSTAGDFDGDGYADVLVGAYGRDESAGVDAGRAYVYRGSATGAFTLGPQYTGRVGAHAGFSVAAAGDVNGDGFGDILIGAPEDGSVAAGGGAASLNLGGTFLPDWQALGNNVNGNFGYSVAGAGDVNGDGYPDVIVGEPSVDAGNGGIGDPSHAYVYLGSGSTTDVSGPPLYGDQVLGQFGYSMANAGDVNGDGFADIVVGAPYDDGSGPLHQQGGRAFLYLGPLSGGPVTPAWTVSGDQDYENLGTSVASAGDVNGDGYDDVLVGSPYYSTTPYPATSQGRVDLYLGSPSGLSTTPAWTVTGTQEGDLLSFFVASAGDVNGDGYADVIVGAPAGNDPAAPDKHGRAYVYLGSAAGLATTPVWMAEGEQDSSWFGRSVASAGDVNGDGYSDIIVGSPGYGGNAGRAYLYLGSPTGPQSTPAWTYADPYAGAVGAWVASAGDVNGDGYSDVAVGAPDIDEVFVYNGSPTGLPATIGGGGVILSSTFSGFGASIAAGDVNGDGYSDLFVGAPGFAPASQIGHAAYFLGSPGGLSTTSNLLASGTTADANLGMSVALADLRGHGRADFVYGSPGGDPAGEVQVEWGLGPARFPQQTRTDGTTPIALHGKSDAETSFRLSTRLTTPLGRGRVRVQWEVKPLGTPFNGTGLFTSAVTDTGAPPAGVTFSAPVTAAEGTFYHWRMRIVSTNPLFPRSPWYTMAANNTTESKLRTAGCLDRDGDGFGALSDPSCASPTPDCDDANSAIWDTPGETLNLRFTSSTVLAWDVPSAPGASTASLVYDTMRSGAPSNFTAAVCVESDDGPNTTATDATSPAAGQAFYYLNRAQDACPNGLGSLGTNSAGAPRTGRACP